MKLIITLRIILRSVQYFSKMAKLSVVVQFILWFENLQASLIFIFLCSFSKTNDFNKNQTGLKHILPIEKEKFETQHIQINTSIINVRNGHGCSALIFRD